jgi:uncharacterized protein YbcV (DUF1398 family)
MSRQLSVRKEHAAMTPAHQATAASCLAAAFEGTQSFPEIVATLRRASFDGYAVDYRRGTATYYVAAGGGVTLEHPESVHAVAERFDAAELERAVRAAQNGEPGYSYAGFCARVMAAGCAGYLVSFTGRRVVYYGRSGETHVEHTPG